MWHFDALSIKEILATGQAAEMLKGDISKEQSAKAKDFFFLLCLSSKCVIQFDFSLDRFEYILICLFVCLLSLLVSLISSLPVRGQSHAQGGSQWYSRDTIKHKNNFKI